MEQTKEKKIIRNRSIALVIMSMCILVAVFYGSTQLIGDVGKAEGQKTEQEKVTDNSANAGKSIDVDKLVANVKSKVEFESTLEKLDDSVASGMIKTADGTKLQVYMGNGTYADELIVMIGKSEADAEKNQQNIKEHFADMKSSFKDYLPAETKKIDKAVTIRCGSYIIACVTSDYEKAKEVITDAIKQ